MADNIFSYRHVALHYQMSSRPRGQFFALVNEQM